MKVFLHIWLLAVSSVLLSCTVNQPEDSQPAGNDKEIILAISADELTGIWEKGDSVSVLDNSGNHLFIATGSGYRADFAGASYTRALNRVVLCPYGEKLEYNRSIIRFDAARQKQRGDKIASAGAGSTKSIQMEPVCSVLEFSIASADVKSVTVESLGEDKIGGDVLLSFSDGGLTDIVPDRKWDSITLISENDTYLKEGKHRINCLPGNYAKGLRFYAEREGGYVSEKNIGPISVERGMVVDMGVVENGVLPELKPTDISVVFHDGTAYNWPFAYPDDTGISSSWGSASFPGQEVVFRLPDKDGGYVFKEYCSNGIAKHGSQGFRFGGDKGAYFEFPSMPGLYLNKVTMVSGNASSNLQVIGADGQTVLGGNVTASFIEAGDTYVWNLYDSQKSAAYRLQTISTGSVAIRKLVLHYDVESQQMPDDAISPLELGLNEARSDVERFQIIKRTHEMAVLFDRDVDYAGVGTVNMEIPSNASSIPLRENTDFKGTVFHVVNKVSKMYLFSLSNQRSSISVSSEQFDEADFSAIPQLCNGLYLLYAADRTPWVENREGYDYGADRKDIILVRDGKGSNKPIAPYSNTVSNPTFSYCPVTDDVKTFCNVTLERDIASTEMIHLVSIDSHNNVYLHDILIKTPLTDWNGDSAISIKNCTNVLMEDATFEGTYSQSDKYGYGIALNNIWRCTFRRLHSHNPWGLFGSNNLQDSLLEDSDVERFDTHCYGRNITVRNSTLTGRGIPVSSIYGTILLENCILDNCFPYSIRPDYNAYVPLEVVMKNCEMINTKGAIMSLGRLDKKINSRPELSKKNWPNLTIEGLKYHVPAGATEVYMYRSTSSKNTYPSEIGYLSSINVKGLEFIYDGGESAYSVPLYISNLEASLEKNLNCVFIGCKLSAGHGSNPTPVYVNLHSPSNAVSQKESDIIFKQ